MKLNNKTILFGTILIIIFLIGSFSIYKVIKNHNDKLYYATITKIEEKALLCFNESKCNEEITLKQLYELEYIEKTANPVTNEYFNEESLIIIKDNKAEFKEN